MIPRVLVIAGSDSGGGAGIQADIKTITMLGGHAMTAITAITAQNTVGVRAITPVPAEMVLAQIDAVVEDIGVDAVKIGMIGSAEVAEALVDILHARCRNVPIVVDPVLVASSGEALGEESSVDGYHRLLDIASLVTPNVTELGRLAVSSAAGTRREQAMRFADAWCVATLAKGGDEPGEDVTDFLCRPAGEPIAFTGSRIDTRHTHGTGCTLSTAIAMGLAAGMHLEDAIARARAYVRATLAAAPGIGAGHGPMGHGLGRAWFEWLPDVSSPRP